MSAECCNCGRPRQVDFGHRADIYMCRLCRVEAKEERRSRAIDLYESGLSLRAVAQRLGVSHAVVYRYVGPDRCVGRKTPTPQAADVSWPTADDYRDVEPAGDLGPGNWAGGLVKRWEAA